MELAWYQELSYVKYQAGRQHSIPVTVLFLCEILKLDFFRERKYFR